MEHRGGGTGVVKLGFGGIGFVGSVAFIGWVGFVCSLPQLTTN